MNKTKKIRELIGEEVRNQLKEYSTKDYVARYHGTNIVIKNAHEVSSDDQVWKSIYEKLSKVAESIAKQTKAWPVEIIVKLY